MVTIQTPNSCSYRLSEDRFWLFLFVLSPQCLRFVQPQLRLFHFIQQIFLYSALDEATSMLPKNQSPLSYVLPIRNFCRLWCFFHTHTRWPYWRVTAIPWTHSSKNGIWLFECLRHGLAHWIFIGRGHSKSLVVPPGFFSWCSNPYHHRPWQIISTHSIVWVYHFARLLPACHEKFSSIV